MSTNLRLTPPPPSSTNVDKKNPESQTPPPPVDVDRFYGRSLIEEVFSQKYCKKLIIKTEQLFSRINYFFDLTNQTIIKTLNKLRE